MTPKPVLVRREEEEREGGEKGGASAFVPEAISVQERVEKSPEDIVTSPPLQPTVVTKFPQRTEPSELVADFMPESCVSVTDVSAGGDLIQFDDEQPVSKRDKPVCELAKQEVEEEKKKVVELGSKPVGLAVDVFKQGESEEVEKERVVTKPAKQVSHVSEEPLLVDSTLQPVNDAEDEFVEVVQDFSCPADGVGMTTIPVLNIASIPDKEVLMKGESKEEDEPQPQTHQQQEPEHVLNIVTNEFLNVATNQIAQASNMGEGLMEGVIVEAAPSAPVIVVSMESQEAPVMPLYPIIDSLASGKQFP